MNKSREILSRVVNRCIAAGSPVVVEQRAKKRLTRNRVVVASARIKMILAGLPIEHSAQVAAINTLLNELVEDSE